MYKNLLVNPTKLWNHVTSIKYYRFHFRQPNLRSIFGFFDRSVCSIYLLPEFLFGNAASKFSLLCFRVFFSPHVIHFVTFKLCLSSSVRNPATQRDLPVALTAHLLCRLHMAAHELRDEAINTRMTRSLCQTQNSYMTVRN